MTGGCIYVLYVSVNPPLEKDSLSDLLSSLSESAIPERFQKLSLAKTTVFLPLTMSTISNEIVHRKVEDPDLTAWITKEIKFAVKLSVNDDGTCPAAHLSFVNLLRFYSMWLRGDFTSYAGKLIVVTKTDAYAMDFRETEMGEREAQRDVGLIFHDEHPALMPAKGFWQSEWLITETSLRKSIPILTTLYPYLWGMKT